MELRAKRFPHESPDSPSLTNSTKQSKRSLAYTIYHCPCLIEGESTFLQHVQRLVTPRFFFNVVSQETSCEPLS